MAIADEWELADQMPIIESPILQLSGLPLIQGCVKCPICDGVFSRSTMHIHHSQCHSGVPTSDIKSLPAIYAQQLNKAKNKTMFEVIIPSAPQDAAISSSVVDYLWTLRNDLVPEYFSKTLDARALSSWAKYTHWHLHVDGYHSSELMALVATPQKNEQLLANLEKAVTAIYNTGYGFIDDSNMIVLHKLKTNDLDGK